MAKEKTKEQRIKKEIDRLNAIYRDLPADVGALYEGLIVRAAYMRVTLEDYEQDMNERGYVEAFSQSDKLEPYERGRPVVGFYNTMAKNYQTILKQLADRLPDQPEVDPSEEILKYSAGIK